MLISGVLRPFPGFELHRLEFNFGTFTEKPNVPLCICSALIMLAIHVEEQFAEFAIFRLRKPSRTILYEILLVFWRDLTIVNYDSTVKMTKNCLAM